MHTDTYIAGRSTITLRSIQPFVNGAITLRVLGEVEVSGPSGTFSPGSARPGALLALLAIHAGQCVAVDRMIDELWTPDSRSSAKRVQVNVLRLRRALRAVASDIDPAALVRTGARGYALQLDPDRIDAVRFERLLAQGRRELAAGDARRAAAALRDALALWRGMPYADFAYESFASAEIRRLEELRASALELWAEAELALGAHAALVPELERLVARDPLRERLRALLMIALYRSCRQAEALTAYQAARRDLVESLGIEPSLELRALQRAILEQCPSLELARSARGVVAAAGRPLAQAA